MLFPGSNERETVLNMFGKASINLLTIDAQVFWKPETFSAGGTVAGIPVSHIHNDGDIAFSMTISFFEAFNSKAQSEINITNEILIENKWWRYIWYL